MKSKFFAIHPFQSTVPFVPAHTFISSSVGIIAPSLLKLYS